MEPNNNQKALGFIFILFLTMTYKDMVWDPYFLGPNLGQPKYAAQPPSTPVPVSTSLHTPVNQSGENPQTATLPPTSIEAGYPKDNRLDKAGYHQLEDKNALIKISLLGGRVREFRLKSYSESIEKDSFKLNLIEHADGLPLPGGVYSGAADDSWVEYQPSAATPLSVTLSGVLPDGRQITKIIKFNGRDYLLDLSVSLSQAPEDGSKTEIEWSRFTPKNSPSFLDSQGTGGLVWFDGERAHREPYNSLLADGQSYGRVRWISTTDHYFVTSLLSPNDLAEGRFIRTDELFRIRVSGEPKQADVRILGGPKSYRILEKIGFGLERNIDFGRTGFLSAPLLSLLHLLYGFLGNYGLAIVALTIIVRLLLLPLNAASFKSMKKMQDLQPEVQKLKDSMKDKQQQQLAMMELYKKKGVNPLGGCLPLLLQFPIFLGLYSALLMAIELRHARFALWITDLSAPERLMIGSIGIPVLVILFVGSMLYQQWATPSTMDETQKKIMLIMPVVFGFVFFVHMPAGLTLYWLTSNIISIAQMHQLRKEGKHSPFLVTTGVAGLTFLVALLLTTFG